MDKKDKKAPTRAIGRTGLKVSVIGLGTAPFGREIDQDASHRVLDYAFSKGVRFIDTAEGYGRTMPGEVIIGNWVRQMGDRKKVQICTKLGSSGKPEAVKKIVQQSLDRLQTDYIDIFKLHTPFPDVPIAETLDALTSEVRAGRIKIIGASNFNTKQLKEAVEASKKGGYAKFEIVQPPYSLAVTDKLGYVTRHECDLEMFPFCKAEGIAVTPYSPLGAGFLTGKYTPDRKDIPKGTRYDVAPAHADIYFTDQNFRILEKLRVKASVLGVSMSQLAIAWVMSSPLVTSTLVGAREAAHIDQAIAAFNMKLKPKVREEMTLWG